MSSDHLITHARDILALEEDERSAGHAVRLRCVLIERHKEKNRIFLSFQDDSGAFQAAVEREAVGPDIWETAVALRPGDSALIRGATTTRFSTAIATLDHVEGIANPVPTSQRGRQRIGLGSSVTQAYVARLQRHVRTLFETEGYTEIVPRLLTTTRPPSPGLYPLQVLYDGFGAPFFISPSPVPQVVRALTSTSYERVFAVSRCFTQGYRDPVVSVESVVISAAARHTSLEEMLLWLDSNVKNLFSLLEVKNKNVLSWGKTKVTRYSTDLMEGGPAVDQPEVQEFEVADKWGRSSVVGRLCWPQTLESSPEFREHVLAEGYMVGPRDAVAFSVVTLNVDRLLTLVIEQADLRRIPALGAEVASGGE